MSGKKGNNLILIENGQLTSYSLDNKTSWEIGRLSKDNTPDIRLHSATVSRKHGKFQNIDGIWFYIDHRGKNGTVYNHRYMGAGINGRIKPVMLKDGDVFVFGGGNEEVINCRTVWGLYVEREYDEDWRIIDSKGYKKVSFISGDEETTLVDPVKGTVIERENGIAVYMGDLIYIAGDMNVICN